VKKCTIAATLFFLINGAYSGVALGKASATSVKATSTGKSEICNDTESLANSLRVQIFDAREDFDSEGIIENELLKLLGVKLNQEQILFFSGAKRISGYCVDHLDDINFSIHHFDTGISLVINDEGAFIPNPKQYRRRPVVGRDDAHPEIVRRQFVEAVEVGWGYFVGIWKENEKSILAYYKETPSREFRVHGDILESEAEILIVRRSPHLDTPSCAIQLLLRDGNDRVALNFIWLFPDDMD